MKMVNIEQEWAKKKLHVANFKYNNEENQLKFVYSNIFWNKIYFRLEIHRQKNKA